MKTIGLLGGMSWESSLEYYRMLNQGIRERLGGLHSARCLMYSFDFFEIEQLQMQNNWDAAASLLVKGSQNLEAGGADCLIICTNTMHKLASQIEAAISIPLIHIADPTAEAIQSAGLNKVGLLGTRFTMEQNFYKGRLQDQWGLQVLIPAADERETIHTIIYDELVVGQVKDTSRQRYQEIIHNLSDQGAEAIILGCTEIGLLIKASDSPLPVFDTTYLHAMAALEWALA
ncbi:aspartate/glutamate racemase family protein [Anaerolineales bacterium]